MKEARVICPNTGSCEIYRVWAKIDDGNIRIDVIYSEMEEDRWDCEALDGVYAIGNDDELIPELNGRLPQKESDWPFSGPYCEVPSSMSSSDRIERLLKESK